MGYIVIENALSPGELARLTAEIDRAEAEEGGLSEYPRCVSPALQRPACLHRRRGAAPLHCKIFANPSPH
jgi:hypothetical protein